MSENRKPGTFSATDLRRRMAGRQAAKAAEEMRHMKDRRKSKKRCTKNFTSRQKGRPSKCWS